MDYNSFVYRWIDKKTGKYYIGSHKGTEDDGYICSSKQMISEYRNRPMDFTREVLEKFSSYDEAHDFEMLLLVSVDAAANSHYYNMHNATNKFYCKGHSETSKSKRKGKESPSFGRKWSAEQKEKIKNKLKGKPPSVNCMKAALNSHIGKKLSNETKMKMSVSRKGKLKSNETKLKMRAAALARYTNNWIDCVCTTCHSIFKRKLKDNKAKNPFCSRECYHNHGIGRIF